jgi:hypothetical protein
MTQMVLNIEDISLVASLKEILSAIKGVTIDRLIEGEEVAAAEKRFIKNTIERGFMQAKEGQFAGKNLTSLDSLVEELRAEIV